MLEQSSRKCLMPHYKRILSYTDTDLCLLRYICICVCFSLSLSALPTKCNKLQAKHNPYRISNCRRTSSPPKLVNNRKIRQINNKNNKSNENNNQSSRRASGTQIQCFVMVSQLDSWIVIDSYTHSHTHTWSSG